jgi:hypothetical protein
VIEALTYVEPEIRRLAFMPAQGTNSLFVSNLNESKRASFLLQDKPQSFHKVWFDVNSNFNLRSWYDRLTYVFAGRWAEKLDSSA